MAAKPNKGGSQKPEELSSGSAPSTPAEGEETPVVAPATSETPPPAEPPADLPEVLVTSEEPVVAVAAAPKEDLVEVLVLVAVPQTSIGGTWYQLRQGDRITLPRGVAEHLKPRGIVTY